MKHAGMLRGYVLPAYVKNWKMFYLPLQRETMERNPHISYENIIHWANWHIVERFHTEGPRIWIEDQTDAVLFELTWQNL